jgi:hypothetical protein
VLGQVILHFKKFKQAGEALPKSGIRLSAP